MIMVPGAASFDEAMEMTGGSIVPPGDHGRDGAAGGGRRRGRLVAGFDSNEQALETLVAAIEAAGEMPGEGW